MADDARSNLLRRVVWSALSTRQRRFSVGNALARRFDPSVSPFAATLDNSEDALAALVPLMKEGADHVYLLQADPISLPEELTADVTTLGVLMVEQAPTGRPAADFDIVPLTLPDVPDMVDLATLTKPGPFTARTPELGSFWGIKREGRLVAMAGTRLNLDGHTEVSGICTHPEFRGQGLGSALSRYVSAEIRDRGDRPFLHAFADNHSAIALYRKLGFEIWSEVNVAVTRLAQ